jgi:hypothetical protein
LKLQVIYRSLVVNFPVFTDIIRIREGLVGHRFIFILADLDLILGTRRGQVLIDKGAIKVDRRPTLHGREVKASSAISGALSRLVALI